LTTFLPDLAVTAVRLATSTIVEYQLEVTGDPGPIHLGLFRSANPTFDASDVPVGSLQTVTPRGGRETAAFHLAGELALDPARPFVLVVADPDGRVQEADEANNSASFRKYVIGAVTHGYQALGTMPAWVGQTAATLHTLGYDAALAFDWADWSNDPVPGRAILAGQGLAAQVRQVAQGLAPGPADVLDVHFIGHSRGAVVISQAVLDLQFSGAITQLQTGYLKMTLLDPHPAHNHLPDPQYSVRPDWAGWLAELALIAFQSLAQDPEVVVPGNVDHAEVYYQHTHYSLTPAGEEQVLNLWGEFPVTTPTGTAVHSCDLTGPGIGHSEVTDWYRAMVVPHLGGAVSFLCSSIPGGSASQAAGNRIEAMSLVGALSASGSSAFAAQPGTDHDRVEVEFGQPAEASLLLSAGPGRLLQSEVLPIRGKQRPLDWAAADGKEHRIEVVEGLALRLRGWD
jgi:hypothetical protein